MPSRTRRYDASPDYRAISRRYPRLNFEVTLLSSPNYEFPDLRHRTIDLMLAALPGHLLRIQKSAMMSTLKSFSKTGCT